jgi:hypothetical protein
MIAFAIIDRDEGTIAFAIGVTVVASISIWLTLVSL